MEAVRIAALLQPYAKLPTELLHAVSTYIDLIVKWNRKVNLTAIRDPEEMVTRHFGESFFAAAHWLAPKPARSAVDIGSGAGFPGLPLAMYSPSTGVTLTESQSRKAAFLNEVIYALGLKNVKVFHGRAERSDAASELVTLRAVEHFEKVLPVAANLVSPGGTLGLMIGASQASRATALAPSFDWGRPIPIPGGRERVLLGGTRVVNVGN